MMKPIKFSASVGAIVAISMAFYLARQPVFASDNRRVPISKQLVVNQIATKVLLPKYIDLADRAGELASAADAFTSAPNEASLERTRQAWRSTLMAWRRTQPFVHGPVADLNVYPRIQFWPSRRQSIDRVLRAPRAIDDSYLQELGAGVVGLSALEIMLFDVRQDDKARLAMFSGREGERQRRYFLALARDLASKTRLVSNAWQGPAGYAAKFGSGGQASLNLLVNDLLAAIEVGAQGRLQTVIDRHTEPQFRTDLVEGGLSGTSHQGLLALLVSTRAAFSGGDGPGLDDYLRQMKSPIAQRVDGQFAKAIAAVEAINGPLELAIDTRERAIRVAHDECRALEIMLKVDVASTLGVTLTFKSSDGD